nr:hypothetical protein Iba_scaffold29910CG0100 [Ipomoea batatas]GMD83430.1 hypothetical protein Iba_chr14aCG5030 [Ipomoea batatas]
MGRFPQNIFDSNAIAAADNHHKTVRGGAQHHSCCHFQMLFPFPIPLFNLCPSLSTTFPDWTPISPTTRTPAMSTSSTRTSASWSPPSFMVTMIASSSRISTATIWALIMAMMTTRTSASTMAAPSPALPK